MRSRRLLVACVVVGTVLPATAASAKTFRPGDLRLCGGQACVAIESGSALDALSRFYYGTGRLARALPPQLGTPMLELRFRNDYVTGIVGTGRFDRFLSYGVNTGRFVAGRWYAVPRRAAVELRQLGARLRPRVLTRAAVARSR